MMIGKLFYSFTNLINRTIFLSIVRLHVGIISSYEVFLFIFYSFLQFFLINYQFCCVGCHLLY